MGVVMVGVNALARETSLPRQTVSRKLRAGATANDVRRYAAQRNGMPPASGGGRPPGEQHKQTVARHSGYEVLERGRAKLEALEDAKLRRALALAERQEIENTLRRAELVPTVYVRRWASRLVTAARDELLRLPSELAAEIAAESDPARVATILRAAAERTIGKLYTCDALWGKGNSD
jgi:hypothetical protein